MTATEGGGISLRWNFFKVAMYVKRQIDGDEQNNAEMFWIFPLLSQIFEKPRANILSLCFSQMSQSKIKFQSGYSSIICQRNI